MEQMTETVHWADQTAERIIRANPDKETYVLASGITPSGTVHFGNFRETITVDLVAKALRSRGKKVRFIFSWDDYDTFRKIPKNLPNQDMLKKYMFQPIVDVPDPYGKESCYARYQERAYEEQLEKVGVKLEPIYQADKYRSGTYDYAIIKTLKERDNIAKILNEYRTEPLPDSWQPISIYCEKCNTDNKIENVKYDGDKTITYHCANCNHDGKEVIDHTRRVKLPWRVDWPMRWVHEGVDFEPGGKDHSSEGGSFTTAKQIVKLYGGKAPQYLQYDFVSVKGRGGKMSSSQGNLVTVNDILDIYEPEMVRWIYASYKSNVDFAIGFDLDVIKMYEDFDKTERMAYGVEFVSDKKNAVAKRVYELAQLGDEMPKEMPIQPAFRHLCNILQIHSMDINKAREFYANDIKNERDERRFSQRAACAKFWLENYAPEDFKFQVNTTHQDVDITDTQKQMVAKVRDIIENHWDELDSDQALHEQIYAVSKELGLKPADAFKPFYKILISKERGPKLAGFMRIIGRDTLLKLL